MNQELEKFNKAEANDLLKQAYDLRQVIKEKKDEQADVDKQIQEMFGDGITTYRDEETLITATVSFTEDWKQHYSKAVNAEIDEYKQQIEVLKKEIAVAEAKEKLRLEKANQVEPTIKKATRVTKGKKEE